MLDCCLLAITACSSSILASDPHVGHLVLAWHPPFLSNAAPIEHLDEVERSCQTLQLKYRFFYQRHWTIIFCHARPSTEIEHWLFLFKFLHSDDDKEFQRVLELGHGFSSSTQSWGEGRFVHCSLMIYTSLVQNVWNTLFQRDWHQDGCRWLGNEALPQYVPCILFEFPTDVLMVWDSSQQTLCTRAYYQYP